MQAIDFLEPICGRMTSQGFTWHYMKLADSFSKEMLNHSATDRALLKSVSDLMHSIGRS